MILQVINQNIYGFAENPSFSTSYNLWKGVIDTVTKNILQVINQIYLWVCRELLFLYIL